MIPLLSQAGATSDVSRIVTVVGVLLVAVIVLAAAVLKLRRRLLSNEDNAGAPLTLHDLRQMHNEGGLTDEEFEKAKAALIGMAKRPASSKHAKPVVNESSGASSAATDRGR